MMGEGDPGREELACGSGRSGRWTHVLPGVPPMLMLREAMALPGTVREDILNLGDQGPGQVRGSESKTLPHWGRLLKYW